MAENLLYLSPIDVHAVPPDPAALIDPLRDAGFIGSEFDIGDERHYRPGNDFLSYITFLGCSPVIAVEQSDEIGEGFNHIDFEGPYELPQHIYGDNLKTPRCPGCGHRFDNWQELPQHGNSFNCPKCAKSLTTPELRWRKCAGFGRFFIKVWGIFESEAVPAPELNALLERVTGCPWHHFYVRINN